MYLQMKDQALNKNGIARPISQRSSVQMMSVTEASIISAQQAAAAAVAASDALFNSRNCMFCFIIVLCVSELISNSTWICTSHVFCA